MCRELRRNLPAAVGVRHDLTFLGDGQRRSRLRRIAYEQSVVAASSHRVDFLHLCDHRPVIASRTPFAITVHDLFYYDYPLCFPRHVAAYKRSMLRVAVAKRPSIVFCPSVYARKRLLHYFPELPDSRIAVVPLAAAEEQSQVNVSSSPISELLATRRYFLTVGTIEPRKNHLTLLSAYQLARRRGLALEWVVVGREGYHAESIVRKLAAEQSVRYIGYLAQPDLDHAMRNAVFVAIPSLAEGFGLPALEAMRRGVPVATSTGSAMDEVVDDAALRVESEDVTGWVDALLRLEQDATLRSRLRRAGQLRAEQFSWRETAALVAAAYDRLAA